MTPKKEAAGEGRPPSHCPDSRLELRRRAIARARADVTHLSRANALDVLKFASREMELAGRSEKKKDVAGRRGARDAAN